MSKKEEEEAITIFHSAAVSAKKWKVPFSDEEMVEHERIAKVFNAESFRYKNRTDKDLTNKIYLMKEAIAVMPAHLCEAALKVDETPPPQDRPWALFSTPPIKDFNVKEYMKADEDEKAEKK